jgi:prolyl-tRNA synthetase
MLDIYTDFARNEAAVPVIPGRKSESEKFAGAVRSYTIEAMMGDRKALQAGTSHNLGQNFAKAFNINYLDENNTLQHCWTTSWGLSTRFIGAIIMTHGDDQGLIMPPRLAPIQVIIIPIFRNDEEKEQVMAVVDRIKDELDGIRLKVDDRMEVTPGFKFNEWELRGVPLRLEIGPKDVAKESVALARRDMPGRAGKSFVPQAGIKNTVTEMLETIQANMLEKATKFRDDHIFEPKDYDEFKDVIKNDGWCYVWWNPDANNEAKIKEETKATLRCIPMEQPGGKGKCIYSGEETSIKAYFAKAY